MYEIRMIGRKKDGDCTCCMYGHFGQASENSVTLSRKRVIRGVRGKINQLLGIGVRVPSRFQNPDLPPRQIEKSSGTKHME